MEKRTRGIAYALIGAALLALLLPVYLGAREYGRARVLRDRLDAMYAELSEMSRPTRLVQATYSGTVSLAQGGFGAAEARSVREEASPEQAVGAGDARALSGGAFDAEVPEPEVWRPTADEADAYSPAASNEEQLHRVYLTFDDGPSIYTDDILDILAEYGVKATFFVVGRESEQSLARYRRIVEEGHSLGMHSYSHKYSEVYASEEAFLADLERIHGLLYETTGVDSWLYRFPGGSSNTISDIDMHVFANCLAERGITYFDWNSASGDATGMELTISQLVENSLAGIESREATVILMHDAASKESTVRALPRIIEAIQAMEDTVILPITEDTAPVQHVSLNAGEG